MNFTCQNILVLNKIKHYFESPKRKRNKTKQNRKKKPRKFKDCQTLILGENNGLINIYDICDTNIFFEKPRDIIFKDLSPFE